MPREDDWVMSRMPKEFREFLLEKQLDYVRQGKKKPSFKKLMKDMAKKESETKKKIRNYLPPRF